MAPTLMESLNQALSRLKVFERELKKAKESIRKKDVEIQELRLQLRQGQPGGGGAAPASRSSDSHDTAKYVSEMRAELAEMKAFLNDYGMVWIGGNKKKVGEEGVELALARMKDDGTEIANEAADLLFHIIVLLQDAGLKLDDVIKVLEERHR